MYGSVDFPDGTAVRPTRSTERRQPQRMPAALALGLTVAGLVAALGLGAALLPARLTGPGAPAELPAAAIAALPPDGAGQAPPAAGTASRAASKTAGDGAAQPSAAATPSRSPSPQPSPSATPRPPKITKPPTPPKPPKITKPPSIAPGLAGQETEVIRLVNVERDKAGCGALRLNTKLRAAIRLHVSELGRHGDLYISHVSDDGRSFVDRAHQQGYNDPGGENVARGQQDAADVMDSWMDSPGHRANILNCSFKAIGVGVAKGVDGTLVWGQIFGRS